MGGKSVNIWETEPGLGNIQQEKCQGLLSPSRAGVHSTSNTDSVLLIRNVLGSQTPKEEWLSWESRSVLGESACEREGESEREQEHENMSK